MEELELNKDLGHNCAPFVTWGSLTLDIAISSYTITPFSFFFSLIYYTGISASEGKAWAPYPSSSGGYRLKRRNPYGIPHFLTKYFQSMGTAHDRRFYERGYGALFEGFYYRELEGGQVQNNTYLL